MEVLAFSKELARQVGGLLLGYYQTPQIRPELKFDRTVVTEADLAADRMIAQALQADFPDDLILSEELQPELPAGSPLAGKSVWVVDPLDGTTNFSLGLPFWGVLLTHLIAGHPETTVMYFPLMDELYSAQHGQGAWMNGNRLMVPSPDSSQPNPFFSCCSRTFRRYRVTVPYKARILGSCAYTFCAVARGTAIVGFEAAPKIWDIAGSWLLVREAGGVIETHDGSQPFPLQPGMNYARAIFPMLAAPTQELALQTRDQIAHL